MFRLPLAACSCACFVAMAHGAPSPIGSWVGHFQKITTGKAYKPTMMKAFQDQRQKLLKLTFLMTFRPNHTYSSKLSTAPKNAPPNNGEWSQKGNAVFLTVPGLNNKTDTLTFSPDGKKLMSHKEGKVVITDLVLTR